MRLLRKWTQRELAEKLGLSQGRLSALENGKGSFTGEQLLLLVQLFNVSLADFAPSARRGDAHAELQNALARWGAFHLRERDDILPSEAFEDVHRVVREALLLGAPRLVAALAPVVVHQSSRVNLRQLDIDVRKLGVDRRLPWLAENILAAIELEPPSASERNVIKEYRRATLDLSRYLSTERAALKPQEFFDAPYDILDPTIRSQYTLDDVIARGSEISRRWRIATELQPEDFARALEAVRAGD